jgi:hypothetical protein
MPNGDCPRGLPLAPVSSLSDGEPSRSDHSNRLFVFRKRRVLTGGTTHGRSSLPPRHQSRAKFRLLLPGVHQDDLEELPRWLRRVFQFGQETQFDKPWGERIKHQSGRFTKDPFRKVNELPMSPPWSSSRTVPPCSLYLKANGHVEGSAEPRRQTPRYRVCY